MRFDLRFFGAGSGILGLSTRKAKFVRGVALVIALITLAGMLAGKMSVQAAVAGVVLLVVVLVLPNRRSGALEIDARGLVRVDPEGGRDRLIDFSKPFGVTLMVSKRSGNAWLGFTTPERTGLLRTQSRAFEGETFLTIDEDLDAGLSELAPEEAKALLQALRAQEHSAFEKMYLTGSQGESIVLEGPLFRVDNARFDLVLPYECRHFAFVERVGRVDGLYEATWLRQGLSEVVLVSAMGPEAETPVAQPPPQGLRHAVDRAFFPPLLSVLSHAKKTQKRIDLS